MYIDCNQYLKQTSSTIGMKYLLTSQIYKSDQKDCHSYDKYPVLYYPHFKKFHCDRHLLYLTIKRTSILKSSLNADELCQGIELFSLSTTTTGTQVDFA